MAIVHFCKNVHFDMDGREYQMTQEISEGLWQVREVRTGRVHEFNLQALQQCYAEGKLVFMEDPQKAVLREEAGASKSTTINRQVEGKEWDKAVVRRMYVKAVEHLPCTESIIKQAIQLVWTKIKSPAKAPHWVNVCAWKKTYMANGKDAFALAGQHQRKGNRISRYPIEVVEIAEDCIDRLYMRRERSTVEEVMEDAVVMVTRENNQRPESQQLPLPTRRLIERLINAIPAYDRYVARHGKVAAHRVFRSKLKHLVTNKPLEAAEIDHTKLDLFVIDDESHVPLGRPWLTICIDSHTRCILGIYIGFEPPSYLTVGKCLKHAFLPKVNLQQQYPDIRHVWEAHGVMEQLFVDNGLEFHSISLEKACFAFGVEIVYTPRKTPWFKGKIERFNRTINQSVSHGIAGTTFSNIFEKDDYDPAKHAVVTLSTLRLIIHKWIADYYHQKPHRGLGDVTPAAMWASSITPDEIALAHNPAEIDMLLGKAVPDKTVSHKGIEINNLLYNCPELMQLRRERGDTFKVEIRVDESDIGHLYVMLGSGQGYIEVPALNQDYAKGMTLWLHNICREYAKKHFKKADVYSYARAKTEIREIVENELKLKRKKSHAKVARYNDTTQQPVDDVTNQKPKSATTRVKPIADNSVPLPLIASNKKRPSYTPIMDQRN
ncbi:Mu transposase C-terminal domain-containing protein [Methylotenera sp.]|uniref:Mu transposase C-terminal domain-containing protein n=1 Tax=Methylotenera sp. TaxID=2051956 RepID=UPI0027238419|nr:Mu transposase C-terminal domain-containing protein [Methylotenera sp.]MDO9204142.1 integrase core domain-containing protein [Methylotenera sp.]